MKYEELLDLLKYRRSIRSFKPDPIPENYVTKILDAAHYAMSGANSQPWEFIIVKDAEMKKKVFNAWLVGFERVWNIEQQRIPEYRHPAFNVPPEEKEKAKAMIGGWAEAPVYVVVLIDPRKQLGTVEAARVFMNKTLFHSIGHLGMVIHLAAASLGLGSQRVDVDNQEPLREVLGYPDPVEIDSIVPIGYRKYEPGPPIRFRLEELTHIDKYDMSKYLRDEDFLQYLGRIRKLGRPGYRVVIGEK